MELGLKGKAGKATFRLNYSLTDATFQSAFKLDSPSNSSAGANINVAGFFNNAPKLDPGYQKIDVTPGNRMPGIPLHNLNVSFNYDITDKWAAGLTVVMHSSAFVRGNENNKHKTGPATPLTTSCTTLEDDPNNPGNGVLVTRDCMVARPDFRYPGKTAGYAVFNFQTSYKLDKGLMLGLQVNNLFDRYYASAGRLGINPFSPSINGVIGVSGFNYNSSEWRSSTLIAPGAPRAAWATLTYDFDAGK